MVAECQLPLLYRLLSARDADCVSPLALAAAAGVASDSSRSAPPRAALLLLSKALDGKQAEAAAFLKAAMGRESAEQRCASHSILEP